MIKLNIIAAAAMLTACLAGQAPAANQPAGEVKPAAAPVKKESPFHALKGRWLRADGGYVLDIRAAARSGALEAFYFNPKSINVSAARARLIDKEDIQVFVELRDVNYPGSTYNLRYNKASDQLYGIYRLGATGEEFEVYFSRLPAGGRR